MNLKVDPTNLFPLLNSIEGTYEAAKIHSREVDLILGLRVPETESQIADQSAPWFGLDPDVLQTPYTELRFMLSKLELTTGEKVVELGSGYSRMAHVMDAHFKGVAYVGVESVQGRAKEAMRVIRERALRHAQVIEGDLFQLPEFPAGDVYFLYDLSSRIESSIRILECLKHQAKTRPIAVVGRGLASRQLIERDHPWLSQVVNPAHYGNFSLYQTA